MKRVLSIAGCALLGLVLMASSASANMWGLSGALLDAVSSVDTWNDYSRLCKQAGNAAVMRSRYQHVLMLLNGDRQLFVYPEAVYQPDAAPDGAVSLTQTEDGFTLSYGADEIYTFIQLHGTYVLQTAAVGGFRLDAVLTGSGTSREINHYEATDATGSAVVRRDFSLSAFNIVLFPRSVEEVRRFNHLRAALYSGSDCLGWVNWLDMPDLFHYQSVGKGTEPVYSSPYGASAWRGADGKAAVGLNGEFWAMGNVQNADGETYACIRYNVNAYVQRIGYIRGEVLGVAAGDAPQVTEAFLAVDVQAIRDTWLTDDPDVSQAQRFAVPAGTQLTCLGLYNDSYAYVQAEVRNGMFVDGGAIVWGFVPLNALTLDPNSDFRSAVQTDVMAALAGPWEMYAGGNMADDRLTLNPDGTFTGDSGNGDPDEGVTSRQGTWTVTRYNPNWNLYWHGTDYELTLLYADGTANVKGLVLDEFGFGLVDNEGGGGYRRPEPD